MSCVAPEFLSCAGSCQRPISDAAEFRTAGVPAGSFEFAARTNVPAKPVATQRAIAGSELFKCFAFEIPKKNQKNSAKKYGAPAWDREPQ
jgi:hypothetical protein